MRTKISLIALSIAALPACGGGSSTMNPNPNPNPNMMMMMMPADDGKPHVDPSLDYTLQPGEEKYLCFAMNMPKDKEVVLTKVVPAYGQGTHHILMAQTLVPEPDGFSECKVLIRNTWVPLYAGGKDSGPLTLPDNTGFKLLVKGQQILMQLHILNATTAPISDKTSLRVEYAEASPSIVPAGIFGIDNRRLTLQPHMEVTNSFACKTDKTLHVFGVLGHMHKLGKHLRLRRGVMADSIMYDAAWSFDTQPIAAVTFDVATGETVTLDCTHNNNTEMPVTYGESTNDEMCSSVLYYTPYTSLDGCVQE